MHTDKKLNIVYFYQYFSTPKGSWGTRVYDFASDWVEKGHKVTVVTSVYSKSDLTSEKFIDDQLHNGINVKVINIGIDNKQSFIRRIFSFIQYSVISSWYAVTMKADVVIASSGPITVGLSGLIAKYFRRRKFVFEVRDLWPEGAIQLGIIKNNFIKFVARRFEKKCYRAASLIVTLSPGMKSYIEKKHDHKNVISVTNAADIELFSQNHKLDQKFNLDSKKYFIYTGNIGEVNNSWLLLNTAKVLSKRGRNDIKIVLVGEGQLREEIEKEARDQGLKNFYRFGLMPKNKLVPLVKNAISSFVPLKGIPILDTSSPNKFFESLSAGTPVIQNTNGWMEEFLNDNNVGFTVDPNDAEGLADLLIKLYDNPELAQEMSERATVIAGEKFDKKVLSEKMLHHIMKLEK